MTAALPSAPLPWSTCAACDHVCRSCGGAMRDHLADGRMCTRCGWWTNTGDHRHDVPQCEHTVYVPEIDATVRCTADGWCDPYDPDEARERRWCPDHCPNCGEPS